MTKELSHVMLELHNVRMKPSNVRKKVREPSNVTTVTCDIRTIQYEDGTIKCEKNVTWYIRLLTSGYRTPFEGGTVELPTVRDHYLIFSNCGVFTTTIGS